MLVTGRECFLFLFYLLSTHVTKTERVPFSIHCNQDPAGICGGAAAYVMLSASGTNVFSSEMYMCDSWFNFQPTGNICSRKS